MSSDANSALSRVLLTRDNDAAPFIIIDKRNARMWLFDAQGQPRGNTAVLLGLARGDDTVPGIGEKPLARVRVGERTTPAGRFVAEPGRNARGDDVFWVDYDAAVSIAPRARCQPRRATHSAPADPERGRQPHLLRLHQRADRVLRPDADAADRWPAPGGVSCCPRRDRWTRSSTHRRTRWQRARHDPAPKDRHGGHRPTQFRGLQTRRPRCDLVRLGAAGRGGGAGVGRHRRARSQRGASIERSRDAASRSTLICNARVRCRRSDRNSI